MSDSSGVVAGSLSDRFRKLSPRIVYHRAVTREYREEIFRLRHAAYLREGAISPQPGELFFDPTDDAENTYVLGVHIDGVLMSSIRLSIATPTFPDIPTAHVFPDVLEPEIDAGKVIVDPTRFVVDHASSRRCPELPYITARLAWMAMEYFDADILLAAVRPEHEAFYRRLVCTHSVAPPRLYPGLSKPVGLTLAEYEGVRDTVHARYPFMQSTAPERDRVFGGGRSKRAAQAGLRQHSAHTG